MGDFGDGGDDGEGVVGELGGVGEAVGDAGLELRRVEAVDACLVVGEDGAQPVLELGLPVFDGVEAALAHGGHGRLQLIHRVLEELLAIVHRHLLLGLGGGLGDLRRPPHRRLHLLLGHAEGGLQVVSEGGALVVGDGGEGVAA